MLLGWLLPDAGHKALSEGWVRPGYKPRHGRPPVALRAVSAVAAAAGLVGQRYLDADDDENRPGAPAPRPRSVG